MRRFAALFRVASLHLLAALVLLTLSTTTACDAPAKSRALRVKSRAQLIGGPRALGEVGDWLLENDQTRFVIQDEGFSRGFGVFGGAVIDADIVRPESVAGDSTGGRGLDNFGEMFPSFFLQAMEPQEVRDENTGKTLPAIEIAADGDDGKPAVLVVRGYGNDFLAMTESINQTLLGDSRGLPNFLFETRYILKPGVRYLEMETRIQNLTPQVKKFPSAELLGAEVPTPFGDVLLFGGGNSVFVPLEAGFDVRFRLEKEYARGDYTLPAFPGLTPEFIASASEHVSYGLLALPPEAPVQNYVHANRTQFTNATPHSLHVPFIASAFTGVFQVLPPPELSPNDFSAGGSDEMRFRRMFIVGDGDVASISDVVYDVLEDKVGSVAGRVLEDGIHRPMADADVVVLDNRGNKVTHARTDNSGHFAANLRPGEYTLAIRKHGFAIHRTEQLSIKRNAQTFVDVVMPAAASVVVNIVEPGAGRVPGKATLVAVSPPGFAGEDPRDFLFDLSLREPYRHTDFIPDDDADESTRRYIEDSAYGRDGTVHLTARPGKYHVVVSRGPEYSRFETDVELRAGAIVAVDATITRVVDTSGYLASDFHLHSQFSLDSGEPVRERIVGYAGEGIELAVSTDHNFVVDYQPMIGALGLERFITSSVGLELTTIDRGHFNGFPLQRQNGGLDNNSDGTTIASRTYGSFAWAQKTPTEIFDAMRKLGIPDEDGKPGKIILQVNHPRDSILGYFDTFAVNADTLEVEGPSGLIAPNPDVHPEFSKEEFSFAFDAMEIFNGKRMEFLRSFTVTDAAPRIDVAGRDVLVDPVSCCEVNVGEVLRERPEFDCEAVPGPCVCDEAHFNQSLADGTCTRGGDVAFPGAVDDWLRMHEAGIHVVGTGNSDSHEAEKEEPGYPRSYIAMDDDTPTGVTAQRLRQAFKAGDVLVTNGPFVRVAVDGKGMGQTVKASDGQVRLDITLDTAPWVRVDTVRVLRGTEVVASLPVTRTGKVELAVDIDTPNDTFVVVEALGAASMFPAVINNEIPPLQFSDVIGSIGGSFGLGANPDALVPATTGVTSPYAITNPIFIDADGGGYTATRTLTPARNTQALRNTDDLPARGRPWVATEEETRQKEALALWNKMPLRKRLALSRLPPWLWPSNDPRDVRRTLMQFSRHAD